MAIQSYGIPADNIAEIAGTAIPGNLYYEIAQRPERVVKPTEQILYDTTHIPETLNLYYQDQNQEEFAGKVTEVFINMGKDQKGKANIVILDQSAFYPNSGGQSNDTGELVIDGELFKVVNVEKVGKSVLHILDKELPDPKSFIGKYARGKVDIKRRFQLMSHHTGTHIVFAAARKILGPHVWQNGAKKTIEQAHLDITHYKGLSYEEEMEIEKEANRIIMAGHKINKYFMDKKEAEKDFGFTLYQGGVVPGNNLRIVQIENTDVEACCGTHHDNTSNVGLVKMLKSHRISDGIVRLYYVAYERALDIINSESKILNSLCDNWSVEKAQIVDTANKFFKEYKRCPAKIKKLEQTVIDYQIKFLIADKNSLVGYNLSDQESPSLYYSNMGNYIESLHSNKKGVVFYNKDFVYVLLGDPSVLSEKDLKAEIEKTKKKEGEVKYKVQTSANVDKKKKVDVLQLTANGSFNVNLLTNYFNNLEKFTKI